MTAVFPELQITATPHETLQKTSLAVGAVIGAEGGEVWGKCISTAVSFGKRFPYN